MSSEQTVEETVDLAVENVGGIDQLSTSLEPPVTLLAGSNATNRTSQLQAIMAAMGSDRVSLKSDAERGSVELSLGGETYTRTLTRENESVVMDGEPYLDEEDDVELADLFAFLLESNEARQAVARNEDLREIIMRPVDTEAIEAKIDRLKDERADIEAEIAEIDEREAELTDLEQRRADLEDALTTKREELEAVESRIDETDVDFSTLKEEKREFETKLDELKAVRNDLEDVRYDLETERESVEALRNERAEVREEIDSLPEVDESRLDEIDEEINRLRGRKQEINSTIKKLQRVIQFNEESLEDRLSVFHELRSDELAEGAGDLTEQLVDDSERVLCWTCGSEVDTDQVRETIDLLQELSTDKVSKRESVDERIDELESERRHIESNKQQREQLQRRLSGITDEIADREAKIEEYEETVSDLRAQLEDREEELEAREDEEDYSEVLELHKQANELELEIDRLVEDVEAVEAEITSIEERLEDRGRLESRRDEIRGELEDLRTRIERIETQAVDEFNEQMSTVLNLLEYENIERIWIESSEQEVRDGRRTVTKTKFDMHIVRENESGSVYEDTLDNLSESEREVTGLVFSLAGYLAHDVHETVPFMLLDSVEAIDSDRIVALVEYLEDYADHLVVALLEEDAEGFGKEHQKIAM